MLKARAYGAKHKTLI